MNTERESEAASGSQNDASTGSNAVELAAVLSVLAFVAVTAISLLFATPQSFQASASPQRVLDSSSTSDVPERPFHERYQAKPATDSVDAPTF
jgi:hypothetical protein